MLSPLTEEYVAVMTTPQRFAYFLFSTAVISLLSCQPKGKLTEEEAELLFAHEVYPILQEKCFACHGDKPSKIEGDFNIHTLEGALAGGESGRITLTPGNAEKSLIYEAVTWQNSDFEMPPKENDRLTDAQVSLVKNWINAGAPWPNDERRAYLVENTEWHYSDGIKVKTSEALSATWQNRRYRPEDLWGFQPVQDYAVPKDYLTESGHPVDAFIQRKLGEYAIEPAPPADKPTLIRRATFDLTGLPPTPEEVNAFVNDSSPDAYEKLIDRLLASPHYGERWGRHWLDVVRYADTDGYSNDFERPNAWRYRDYVIRSFNDDKPYNQFIREQIAGDEIDPTNPEMLVAVGYLRMGPWEHTAMSVAAETRQLFLDDVTNSVGETFMAIPLRCASCHDHKFDPIPTRDYYRIQASFAPVQFAEREADYLPSENQTGFEAGKVRLERLIAEAEQAQWAIYEKEENAARRWMTQQGLKYLPPKQRKALPENQQPPRFYGLTDHDLGYRKVLQKRLQVLRHQLKRYDPLAYSVYNGAVVDNPHSGRPMKVPDSVSSNIQSTFILSGGSVHAPDQEVTPGVLSAIRTFTESVESPIQDSVPDSRDGRRIALAKWLASADNPLTTRSIVNRIWQYHFGQGLAGNANNFGVMGKKPTHPELLDWLTTYFIEHGWSFKEMHRLIMTSETYQRSSTHPDTKQVNEVDPNNHWLAYYSPRRLTAEELRDAMLVVSGELNTEMGGLPIKPEINREVAMQPRHIMGSIAPAYQPSRTPQERNRRTIYTYHYRGMPNPMLEVFNQPNSDLSCEARIASTVTPQVFTLFNGQNSYNRALAMAHQLEQRDQSLESQIKRAINLAWNRSAEPQEVQTSADFVEKMVAYHQENEPIDPEYPVEVERTMFEEMTGEEFSYTERLDMYEDYVADIAPSEVPSETRALADLCRVLFNANEFVYVY
ncbi:PSD1 and planctomycete cytochrome C domain-containing protein [Tunicatimonas pelagia]|uniref:PSD1 and planctomycete cytochrome C domain-containing protein n=1 Tax=Tunicatimonas pelagia TaxID=931531 RepID=UPI0026663721|nr:PSD1 and planctomycete cytochrome C domain-containing protein [Tunicatimonas pelagia]WKN44695.1 PSD1 and planctomycete cytochrome C domain-containing protein [Tunicatimonas pelagia]